MPKENTWRARKYSRRLTLDQVTGNLVTTTYSGEWKAEYLAYLDSPEWAVVRKKRLDYDNNKCVVCDSELNLEVHHKTYVRLKHEALMDLETLCRTCHENRHKPLFSSR